jgi:hypothetical protein
VAKIKSFRLFCEEVAANCMSGGAIADPQNKILGDKVARRKKPKDASNAPS